MRTLTKSNAPERRNVRFRWLRVMLKYAIHKYRVRMRGFAVGRPQRGNDDGSSGTFRVGKPVPVRPTPPHHLVGAKEFPPSDRTHSYPAD
jgi:hypothetical protein